MFHLSDRAGAKRKMRLKYNTLVPDGGDVVASIVSVSALTPAFISISLLIIISQEAGGEAEQHNTQLTGWLMVAREI